MFVVIAEDTDGFGECGSIDAVGCPPHDSDEIGLLGADRADHRVWSVVEFFRSIKDALADFGSYSEVVRIAVDHARGG